MRKSFGAMLGGGLLAVFSITAANAYFIDGAEFAVRGGAATATLQIELAPDMLELLRTALADVEAPEEQLERLGIG